MNRPFAARWLVAIVPVFFLLASFGRLVCNPASVLVDARRPTVDRARVVDATPGNDLTRQFWPLHLTIARALRLTGHLPHWDDRGFGGRPLVGNPQAGLFYPPVWLAWLIPAPATLGWITVAHLIGASGGMIRLTRTVGINRPGQMVAAGCYILGPYVLAQTFEGHYPHVWAACWYPWAFDAVIELGRGSWAAGLRLAFSLAAVLLTGHPQEGFYLVLALGIWAGIDSIRLVRSPALRWQRIGTGTVGISAVTLGLGMVAVDWIPATLAQTWTLRSARLPLHLASRYHPGLANAWQLIDPLALGGPSTYFGPENYWETVVSIGLIPLILAIAGAAWTTDRRRVRGWIVLVIAATWFAAGRKLGFFALMYEWVPGIDRFRVPSRSLFLATLGAAVLAGSGVEALGGTDQPQNWVRLGRRWAICLALLLATAAWGRSRVVSHDLTPESFGSSGLVEESRSRARSATETDRHALAVDQIVRQGPFWGAVLGLSISLVWGIIRPATRRSIAVGLGLLGLVELAGSGWAVLVTSEPRAWLAEQPVSRAIQQSLARRRRQDEPPPRLRADEAVLTDLMAAQFDLRKTDINDTFQIQHAADLYQCLYELSRPRSVDMSCRETAAVVDRIQQTQQAVFDRLGVVLVAGTDRSPRLAALIKARQWPIEAESGPEELPSGRFFVARNQTALPRAYVVPSARVVGPKGTSPTDRFLTMNPRQVVLMTADPLGDLGATSHRQQFCPAAWTSTDSDQITLAVTTDGPGLLVIADTWMPGWTATHNGHPVEILCGNHAQRVIALPSAGDHQVVLKFRAPGFRVGLTITVTTLMTWLGLCILVGVRSERSKRRSYLITTV